MNLNTFTVKDGRQQLLTVWHTYNKKHTIPVLFLKAGISACKRCKNIILLFITGMALWQLWVTFICFFTMIGLFQDGNKINFVVIMNYKTVATRSLKRSLALMNHISSQMVDKMYHTTSQVFLIIHFNNNCCDCVLATLHAGIYLIKESLQNETCCCIFMFY